MNLLTAKFCEYVFVMENIVGVILVPMAFVILLALLWCTHKITRAVVIKRLNADSLDDLLDEVVKMKYDIFQIRDRISKILEQDGLVVRFEDSAAKSYIAPALMSPDMARRMKRRRSRLGLRLKKL